MYTSSTVLLPPPLLFAHVSPHLLTGMPPPLPPKPPTSPALTIPAAQKATKLLSKAHSAPISTCRDPPLPSAPMEKDAHIPRCRRRPVHTAYDDGEGTQRKQSRPAAHSHKMGSSQAEVLRLAGPDLDSREEKKHQQGHQDGSSADEIARYSRATPRSPSTLIHSRAFPKRTARRRFLPT